MASWSDRSISGDEGWVDLTPEISFQSRLDRSSRVKSDVMRRATSMAIERMLGGSQYSSSSSPYAVGMENINQGWGNEQLAWHLLGFYIDCNSEGDDEEEDHEHEGHEEEEEPQGDGNRRLNNDNDGSSGKTVCKRKVMYAVYVDPYYQGGGLSEYSFYDQDSGQYVCYSGNCKAKMDCHSSDTQTWQLVGVFKVDKLNQGDSWMEQLFKHAGVCYWGWDNYQTASTMRELLPERCTKTSFKTLGQNLYMHVRPTKNAGLTLGLYTDDKCSINYETNSYDVFSLAGTTESNFNTFNKLLNGYKTCQPCIAYNLTDSDYTCNDDAGYTNCIQCVKFAIKAQSTIATPQDLKLAYMQQTMLPIGNLSSLIAASSFTSEVGSAAYVWTASFPLYVVLSFIFFLGSLVAFFLPSTKSARDTAELKTPLTPISACTERSNDTVEDDALFTDSYTSQILDNSRTNLWKDTTKNLGSTRIP